MSVLTKSKKRFSSNIFFFLSIDICLAYIAPLYIFIHNICPYIRCIASTFYMSHVFFFFFYVSRTEKREAQKNKETRRTEFFFYGFASILSTFFIERNTERSKKKTLTFSAGTLTCSMHHFLIFNVRYRA